MEQMFLKKGIISVVCENCGRTNEISLKYFYDGFEGPFLCKYCGSILDIDIEEE